jgi:hypothetical protein
MALLTEGYLRGRVQKASGALTAASRSRYAQESLKSEKRAFASTKSYDVFLSHSYADAEIIEGFRSELVEQGFSVYVDWIDDSALSRDRISGYTAEIIRGRMNQCACLLYAVTEHSRLSVWMPWELGYMDARTSKRVAIAPIQDESKANHSFPGQEYLQVYPYLDRTGTTLYVHKSSSEWVGFAQWVKGANPQKH